MKTVWRKKSYLVKEKHTENMPRGPADSWCVSLVRLHGFPEFHSLFASRWELQQKSNVLDLCKTEFYDQSEGQCGCGVGRPNNKTLVFCLLSHYKLIWSLDVTCFIDSTWVSTLGWLVSTDVYFSRPINNYERLTSIVISPLWDSRGD